VSTSAAAWAARLVGAFRGRRLCAGTSVAGGALRARARARGVSAGADAAGCRGVRDFAGAAGAAARFPPDRVRAAGAAAVFRGLARATGAAFSRFAGADFARPGDVFARPFAAGRAPAAEAAFAARRAVVFAFPRPDAGEGLLLRAILEV
jgi:hypothetical protein